MSRRDRGGRVTREPSTLDFFFPVSVRRGRFTEFLGKKFTQGAGETNMGKPWLERHGEREGMKKERQAMEEGMERKSRGRGTERIAAAWGMEPWNAVGMGSHACVSSNPAGGGVCSFFFSFPFFLSFRCCSLSSSTASRSVRFGASQGTPRFAYGPPVPSPHSSVPSFRLVSSRFGFRSRLPPFKIIVRHGGRRDAASNTGAVLDERSRDAHREKPAMNPFLPRIRESRSSPRVRRTPIVADWIYGGEEGKPFHSDCHSLRRKWGTLSNINKLQ